METARKISSGVKWAIIAYVVFLFAAELNVYFTHSSTIKEALPTAMRFAIYGLFVGAVFGYIGEEDDDIKRKRGEPNRKPSSPGMSVFGSIFKIIEAVLVNLKTLILLAAIAAGVYLYYKYH